MFVRAPIIAVAIVTVLAWFPVRGHAQEADDFDVLDSTVGYIDIPVPADILRLRYDAGYRFLFPNRGEFFYPKPGPSGPGLPRAESRIDYQELFLYGETLLVPRVSAFLEVPVRAINPEVNANATGFSDLTTGVKVGLIDDSWCHLTGQLRVYTPTGDGDRGLGTEHVSLEPGLLFLGQCTDRCNLYGELRYWVPIGGTNFAGDIIRYGLGASYELLDPCGGRRVAPVVEFVGWTLLDGLKSRLTPGGVLGPLDATGDTIVNAKVGVRFGWGGPMDFFVGYGQALTGNQWYQNVLRLECRWAY